MSSLVAWKRSNLSHVFASFLLLALHSHKIFRLKHLQALNKYFWKYRIRLGVGILFIVVSNYFGILFPQVTGYVIDLVQQRLGGTGDIVSQDVAKYDYLVRWLIRRIEGMGNTGRIVAMAGIIILVFALLKGFFMFLMRQTIIVMSRHIEYDQKNEVFNHYQTLDTAFYKSHRTGDLMNRIAEDVSRVRMFTGPAIMYFINLITLISLSLYFMIRRDALLTLYVLTPLPLLAATIYYVNRIIHKKSERNQALLSELTTNAQESYSGIRVIKSFVQEKAMIDFYADNSEEYRKNAIGLAKVEAIYFPSMTLLIGLSTLLTIMIGGLYYINSQYNVSLGTITEFVIYINLLTFPVSAIGWTASMTQRAAASQKRLNEFLGTEPEIANREGAQKLVFRGNIAFSQVNFVYPHTGIRALRDFSLSIRAGQKVAIVGRTGSGKSTVAHLLLRLYDVSSGSISIDNTDIRDIDLKSLREQISYVPQDVFLFSDTVENNIRFGTSRTVSREEVVRAARQASVHDDIMSFEHGYQSVVGERGVTLSGGQKQRVSIARALLKEPNLVIFDDCLSAVDARTEKEVIGNLYAYLKDKTAIIITHRIFSLFEFDHIVVLDDGKIIEEGTHETLLAAGGAYADLYARQQQQESAGDR